MRERAAASRRARAFFSFFFSPFPLTVSSLAPVVHTCKDQGSTTQPCPAGVPPNAIYGMPLSRPTLQKSLFYFPSFPSCLPVCCLLSACLQDASLPCEGGARPVFLQPLGEKKGQATLPCLHVDSKPRRQTRQTRRSRGEKGPDVFPRTIALQPSIQLAEWPGVTRLKSPQGNHVHLCKRHGGACFPSFRLSQPPYSLSVCIHFLFLLPRFIPPLSILPNPALFHRYLTEQCA